MRLTPNASRIFVGLAERWVDMNRAEYFIQPQTMLHGEDEFGDNVACMRADDCHAKNLVFSWHCQDFDEPMRFAIGDSAIQIINAVCRNLIRNVFFFGVFLVEADTRHFGIGKCRPWNDTIIDLEPLEGSKERVYARVPGLMRGGMCKLIWPCDVAANVNARDIRFKK